MTTYIIKTILCSAILILFYYLVLEREKIYRFNRFYLLFSIVFAFIVPLIAIKIRTAVSLMPATVYQPVISFQGTVTPVSYTHLRAHETVLDLVCRLLLENKKKTT